jgi:diguanylate cyclase (GGDEF)-like protein/PAS domain S-box-containing protein
VDEEAVRDPARVLRELLERYPHARVSATTAEGGPAPVPADLALGKGHISTATPGLLGYVPEDRVKIIVAFEQAQAFGLGQTEARLLNDPTVTIRMYLVDTRSLYGVLIAMVVPEDRGSVQRKTFRAPVVPPRLARVRKSRTSTFLDIDDAASSILGWSREEMVGRRSLEFIHPDDQGLAVENWMDLLTGTAPPGRIRLRHKARSGAWVWFEMTQTNLLATPDACVLAEMVDVSQEMAAQQALEAREQLLHQLAQALPLGIFQIDSSARIVYTNERLFEVLGTPQAETVAEQFATVRPEDGQVLSDAIRAVLGGAAERMIDVRLNLPGSPTPRRCQLHLRPLLDQGTNVVGAVGCVADVTESTLLREELEDRATFDNLTRCYNRPAVLAVLDAALVEAQRSGTGTAVVFVDLDLFKSVNDRLGHATGDELLIHAAGQLRSAVQGYADVGRIGGDEFLVVYPNVGSAEDAMRIGEQIAMCLREEVSLGAETLKPSASVGVAWTPTSLLDADRLVAEADAAMYDSKRLRKGEAVLRTLPSDLDGLVPHQPGAAAAKPVI